MIEVSSLSKTPQEPYSSAHYFCDYVELLAIFSGGDMVGLAEIYDRFLEAGKIRVDEESNFGPNSDEIGTERGCEANDVWQSRIRGWFEIISVRQSCYKDDYPFVVNLEIPSIRIKENLSGKNKIYLSLLVSSCLNLFSRRDLLTSNFEFFSYLVLRNYLPKGAQVHHFGKSSLNNNRYTGSLKSKVDKLADDLSVKKIYQDKIFSKTNSGDGGVDIVAWLPFFGDENLSNIQVFFGQSAAGKNWTSKQDSVSRMQNYVALPNGVHNIIFVPYDLRDGERDFSQQGEITAEILFDRFRIINLIEENDFLGAIQGQEIKAVIEYLIEYEEDIV